jgi:hypothetical protein
MDQKLMAFWKYDLFPYLLWGEVGSINKDGLAYIPSYQGSVKAVLILPLEQGRDLADKLERFKIDRLLCIERINVDFRTGLGKLLDKYKGLNKDG